MDAIRSDALSRLDLTQSRIDSARRLATRVGLDHLVNFVQGDATAMPLPGAIRSRLGQAWVHIPDKVRCCPNAAASFEPGGILAFTDIVSRVPLTGAEWRRCRARCTSVDRHRRPLSGAAKASGFAVERYDAMAAWRSILIAPRMYRSLKDTTISASARRTTKWDRCAAFVGLAANKLGGALVVAKNLMRVSCQLTVASSKRGPQRHFQHGSRFELTTDNWKRQVSQDFSPPHRRSLSPPPSSSTAQRRCKARRPRWASGPQIFLPV
jgi:hypothetical protein